MQENTQSVHDKQALDGIISIVTNKRIRSFLFLILTAAIIVVINGLMPLISGQTHYTADPVEMTYKEYLTLKESNPLHDMTFRSVEAIRQYKQEYKDKHPDIPLEEIILIEPPDNFKVTVYTKFFFESLWWYFDTGLSVISSLFLFFATFNFLVVQAKDKNLDYLNSEGKIKQLNESYLDPDTFENWMENDFNYRRRVAQHKRNVKHALKSLEEKTSYKIKRKFKHYFSKPQEEYKDTLLPTIYVPMSEEERKYLELKEELLSQLEDYYINEIVAYSKVKYFKEIKPGFVYSGVNTEGVHQDEYSAIKTDNQRIRSTMLSKILMSVAASLAFASLLTVLAVDLAVQSPLYIVLSVLTKLAPLMIQIYMAFNHSEWFMTNQLLPNLKFRENIAMLYLAEMQRQGKLTKPVIYNQIQIVDKKGRVRAS